MSSLIPERYVDRFFDRRRIEPFPSEVRRIDLERYGPLTDGIFWAYNLEVLKGNPYPFEEKKLIAPIYRPLYWYHASEIDPKYADNFIVITWDRHSPTQGIVITDLDRERLKLQDDGFLPMIYQFGQERREAALAERAWYLGLWNSYQRGDRLYRLEESLKSGDVSDISVPYPARSHEAYKEYQRKRNITEIVGRKLQGILFHFKRGKFIRDFGDVNLDDADVWPLTPAFSNFSYRKLYDDSGDNSRNTILDKGIYVRQGKHVRSLLALGPMYDVSGGLDAVITAAMSGMLATIPRNGLFADPERQYALAEAVMEKLKHMRKPSHEYGDFLKETWKRNVSVALGCANPDETLDMAKRYFELGITHFKIFTISSNKFIIETCRKLRDHFGNKVEIFAGQIADKKEAEKLIQPEIAVDGLCLGHGGGRQCTSAEGGMGIATIELLASIREDVKFQKTTLMVEGGVGEYPGIAVLMGADGIYYYQRIMGTVIESPNGDMLVESRDGELGALYRGEASAVTSTIESALDPRLRHKHFNPAGRTTQTEGKWGITRFHKKASSGTYKTFLHLRYVAKMLADVGVKSIGELRLKLSNPNVELLTSPTESAEEVAKAYKGKV